MTRKKLLLGIWLTSMALLALTAFTVYFVAQMRFSILLYSYSALAVTQLYAVVVFLIGSEKVKNLLARIAYRLCCIASVAVIPAFCFIFFGLISQYHANIPEAIPVSAEDYASIVPGEETTIYKTDSVYVFFQKYTQVDLECGTRPSQSDASITWCSGAAFQHAIELGFSQTNVEGYHASKGEYYDSPYVYPASAAVVFYDGGFRFEFDDVEGAVKEAAEHGGSGFLQFRLLQDGEIVNTLNMPRVRSYRALCELNGSLCVIDSIEMMHFDAFLAKLQELHVTNAVYMDMGAGWNYSWYRTVAGKVRTLFGLKVPWSHNWIVFRQ